MAEFYVRYNWLGVAYIAIVVAPEAPANLRFKNYEEFHAAMDALGHLWQMTCETPHPGQYAFEASTVWEKQEVKVKALTLARPIVSLPGGIEYG